jgi:hypothetical protein
VRRLVLPLACGVAISSLAPAAAADSPDADDPFQTAGGASERAPGTRKTVDREVTNAGGLEDATTKPVSFEMGAYKDNEGVTVFTPSVSLGIENVDGASLHGSYLVDVVSAASVDIVSTASPRWQEVRHASSLYGQYKPKDFGVGLGGSVSNEPDYLAYGGFATLTHDFDEKNWTLVFGAGLGHDTVGRCGGLDHPCTPSSVFSRDVWRGSFSGGANLVLDRASTLAATADVVLERGDQSKPYRYVPVFAPDVAGTIENGESPKEVNAKRLPEKPLEQLPLTRDRFSLTFRYARRFDGSTLRLFERGYRDSWGLTASTTDARWVFDLGRRFAVWPHARFHFQREVNFWKLAYVSAPGWNLPEYRTGDRELGPLWTAGGGAGVQWSLGKTADPDAWALQFAADAMYTSFQNDLYITSRVAMLGSLSLAGVF